MNEFSNTTNSGILKENYDSDSLVSEALKKRLEKKRKKFNLESGQSDEAVEDSQ